MKEDLVRYFNEQAEVIRDSPAEDICRVCEILMQARKNGNSIYIAGNGGSASAASHFTNDLVKGLSLEGKKRFKAFCLCDQVSVITALGNDYSYDDIFIEQLKNYGKKNDVLVVISGSGNSMNVVKACEYANSIGMISVALTGRNGGKIKGLCNETLVASTWVMERIEDVHMVWMHGIVSILKDIIEKEDKE